MSTNWWIIAPPLKGDKGDPGTPGATGLMPNHQWQNTSLRFQQSPTEWGNYVNLKGDTGAQGIQGVQGLKGDKGDSGAYVSEGVFKIFAQPVPTEGGELILFYPGRFDDSQNLCWVIDVQGTEATPALRVYRYNANGVLVALVIKNDGTINFPTLKNNSTGLEYGDLWRDSNGFLRIV